MLEQGGSNDGGARSGGAPTPADKISITHFVPPPALAPFVTQIYHFRCDESDVRGFQPAALGQLIFLLDGEGGLTFADGHYDRVHAATIMGPGLEAAKFAFEGPFEDLGLALTPLGFVALTGRSAADYADRAVAAETLLDQGIVILAHRFREMRRDGGLRVSQMIEDIASYLTERAANIPPQHMRLTAAVAAWISSHLDPDVEELYRQLPMSRSTVSRLVTRYFGAAPKQLARKYRAVRSAVVLVDPESTDAMRARVESLFYDQPHMIREIRQFTGCTPGALDSEDARILRVWLSKDNFRNLDAYPG